MEIINCRKRHPVYVKSKSWPEFSIQTWLKQNLLCSQSMAVFILVLLFCWLLNWFLLEVNFFGFAKRNVLTFLPDTLGETRDP